MVDAMVQAEVARLGIPFNYTLPTQGQINGMGVTAYDMAVHVHKRSGNDKSYLIVQFTSTTVRSHN